MKKSFTYRDIDFNFIAHPITGDVSAKSDVADVQQSIKNIVLTGFYERGFNPDLGCSAGKYQIGELITPIAITEIKQDIEVAVKNFEPRADLVSVDVGATDNYLQVTIKFNVLNNEQVNELSIKLRREG